MCVAEFVKAASAATIADCDFHMQNMARIPGSEKVVAYINKRPKDTWAMAYIRATGVPVFARFSLSNDAGMCCALVCAAPTLPHPHPHPAESYFSHVKDKKIELAPDMLFPKLLADEAKKCVMSLVWIVPLTTALAPGCATR